MKKTTVFIISGLLLTACQTTYDFAGVRMRAAETESACRQQHLQGKIKSYSEEAHCSRQPYMQAMQSAEYPYPKLVMDYLNARRVAAGLADERKMTRSEADMLFLGVEGRMAEEELARTNQLIQQHYMANQQFQQGLANFNASMQASQPRTIECNTIGTSTMSTTNCTGF